MGDRTSIFDHFSELLGKRSWSEVAPILITAAFGEHLDMKGVMERLEDSEDNISLEFSDVQSRLWRPVAASNNEIRQYLQAKCYWGIQLRRSRILVSESDELRLGTKIDELWQIATAYNTLDWKITAKRYLEATPHLLENFRPSKPKRLPSTRIAAVVFTDIVGFTAMSYENEEGTLKALKRFKLLARQAIADSSGHLVKFTGDGFVAYFETVGEALDFSLHLSEKTELPVRTGIHVGEIDVLEDSDIQGHVVNLASRIQESADPGSILLSEDARRMIRQRRELELHDLGFRSFSGVQDEVKVFSAKLP